MSGETQGVQTRPGDRAWPKGLHVPVGHRMSGGAAPPFLRVGWGELRVCQPRGLAQSSAGALNLHPDVYRAERAWIQLSLLTWVRHPEPLPSVDLCIKTQALYSSGYTGFLYF